MQESAKSESGNCGGNKTSQEPPKKKGFLPISARFLMTCPVCNHKAVEISGLLTRRCTNCGWTDMPPST